jgi:hypothetical protein
MESQDREPDLELSLSQLPKPPLQLLQPPTKDEAGPSKRRKRPRIEQLWHRNLQDDTRVLVILLQVVSMELGGHEVTFQRHYQGSNSEQYRRTSRPREGDSGHH